MPGSILIDDNIKFRVDWERSGGIFIHHINTKTTLEQLQRYGIASSSHSTREVKEADKVRQTNAKRKRSDLEDERPDTPY